jgi:hypothetical protein
MQYRGKDRCSIPCRGSPTCPDPSASTTSSCKTGLASYKQLARDTYFFLVTTCSANISTQYFALNSLMKRGSQSSLAIPRSLQQRISALLLTASVAVGIPLGSKYSCSPRATPTSLIQQVNRQLSVIGTNHEPSEAYERVLPAHNLRSYIRLTSRRKTPSSRSEGLVEYAAVFDLRQVKKTVCRIWTSLVTRSTLG